MPVVLPALAVGAAVAAVDQTVVVIGVLEISFRGDPVTRRNSVLGQGKVLVEHLLSRATDLYVRSAALNGMVSGG